MRYCNSDCVNWECEFHLSNAPDWAERVDYDDLSADCPEYYSEADCAADSVA